EGRVSSLASTSDGRQLFSGGADGIIHEWNASEGKSAREFKQKDAVTQLAIQRDGRRFATAGTGNIARLWDAENGKVVAELKGDRYAYELVADTDRALTAAKATTDYSKKSLETTETEAKKQLDRVATATATNTFTEKVFLEKEKAKT